MRRLILILLACLLTMLASASCFAWEFTMKGEAEWRYRYWARSGNHDIFGTMDSNQVNLGINHLNTFPTSSTTNRVGTNYGVLAGENNFGSEMNLTDYRMTLFPKITVNKAISVEASVNFTSLGIWSDGLPLMAAAPPNGTLAGVNPGYVNSLYVPISDRPVAVDVPNTYVTVQWLKMSIKTPMLDFSIGYKNSSFGMGLWKHGCNRASASFGMSAHYGPFKIGFSPYFSREQSSWKLGSGTTSRNTGQNPVERHEDRRNYFLAAMGEFEYSNGPLVIQLLSDSYRQPSAPWVTDRGAALAASPHKPGVDTMRYRVAAAMKYNNGRFFFNAEADWFNRWVSGRGTANPTSGSSSATDIVVQNQNNGAWLYAVDFGAMCGPSRVTLNYVRATGDDPSTRITTEDAVSGDTGVTDCYMKQWGYLMYFMYGTGDGWDAAGYGQPTNFQHVGGRLDYAVAANLNVFGVYAYAWRDQPNAYRLGGDYRIGARAWTNDDIIAGVGHVVPDSAREIGWEVDFGANWKLLENLTWNTTCAYWQPGTWWSYAYPNTAYLYRLGGRPLDNTSETNAIFGAGRKIDPLMAVETTILVQF